MKQISFFYILLFFTVTLFSSSLNGFDFDNFFNSLFEEKSEDSSAQNRTKNSKSKEDNQQLNQEVATTKKDNFLIPLTFTQEANEESNTKTVPLTKIKVPQEKREAYLYYTQKLVDFFDIIRSHLDLTMKEQTSEFLSLSHSITTDVLSIDRQYLLKTFYHKDFDNLRKKIYQALTKKTTQFNLRNIIKELQKLKELEGRSSSKEDAEERLTFEQNPHLSEKKRSTLVKQLNTIATKELQPILELLEQLPFHEYATAEKNKKVNQNKNRKVQNRSYRSNSSWRPSYSSGSARRSPYYNNRNSSSPYYNDYYGDGGSYYPSHQSSSSSSSPSPSTPSSSTPSSSGTTSSLANKDEKKEEEKQTVGAKIENLFNGFGKEITQAVHALAQEKGITSNNPKEQKEYLFDKKLGTLIDHPQIDQYFAQIEAINQNIHELESNKKETTSKSSTTKSIKTASPADAEQIKKYQAFKKPLALALCRAKNAFCEPLSPRGSRFPPTTLFKNDEVNFDKSKRYNMIKQTLDTLEPLHTAEIKKRTDALEALNTKYDDQSISEFKATIDFLNKYNTEMKNQLSSIATARASGGGGVVIVHAINTANDTLKAILEKPEYKEIKKEFKDKLPLFIDLEIKYPGHPAINTKAKEEIIDSMNKILNFHWKYVVKYHAIFTKQFPTQKIAAKLLLFKKIVKKFIYRPELIDNCKAEINTLIAEARNNAFKTELEVFKMQELKIAGRAEIERTWGVTLT